MCFAVFNYDAVLLFTLTFSSVLTFHSVGSGKINTIISSFHVPQSGKFHEVYDL